LIEEMKTYRPRYDGVDWVAKSVRYIVDLAQKHLPMLESRSESTISSWTEILQLYPNYYLRLAMTMDLSIRNGKIPQETDFPQSLRGIFEGKLLMSPISMMLMHSPRPDSETLRKDSASVEFQTHDISLNGPAPVADAGVGIGEGVSAGYGAGWDNASGSPSTTPRSSELGFDPLILELGFEAGILSPLVEMEFTGNEATEPGPSTTSPNQWNAGLSSFDASCLGIGTDDQVMETFLEV
jgi:hypothetical protein